MSKNLIFLAVTILVAASLFALPRGASEENQSNQEALNVIDNTSLINANLITMFVTNHGNFGRDLSGYFGYDYGTWFPVTDTSDIRNNTNLAADHSPLYSAGLWIGGKVNGDTRVTISEYASDYVPGPMLNGTSQPDNPNFRNFKLYKDSLENNPNTDYIDYLNHGVAQGAPVDDNNKPIMRGDQLLWSVYNDADPNQYSELGSEPLGIEVQQSVYAYPHAIIDSIVSPQSDLYVSHVGITSANVIVELVDPAFFTGHSYRVEFADSAGILLDTIVPDPINEPDVFIIDSINTAWHLFDETEGVYKLMWQTYFNGEEDSPIVDGYQIKVYADFSGFFGFSSFEVVANGAGVVDPPEAAAAQWHDYPVPTGVDPDGYPTDGQQVGDGMWLFATGDNGGTNDDGNRGPYTAFLDRVLRNNNIEDVKNYDFEMRFTTEGSYALGVFEPAPEPVYQVPFELWRVGVGTPDDPSDDVRLTPWMIDTDGDGTYNLGNWGDSDYGSGTYEHSISSGNNDPQTDWIYWILPEDDSPGDAGYNADVASLDLVNMNIGSYDFNGEEIMARTVLVNWNGGSSPPFNQDLPEVGTVFRINTIKHAVQDTFYFEQNLQTDIVTNPDGSSIYLKYKLYNKGSNTINDMYVSLWADPDLGDNRDDLVGCDSLLDMFFCYNSSLFDVNYGNNPPAIGYKFVNGPVVPSTLEDTAVFDNSIIPGYKNLGMTAHSYYINGTDPDDPAQAYNYMQGLQRDGTPYIYNGLQTNFMYSGDPVTGFGDLDQITADKRMMGSMGPFNMNPGDSQYVFIKMAVVYGTVETHTIDMLRTILQSLPPNDNAQLKSAISPNPQYMIFKKAIEPMTGTILFGYDDNTGVGDYIDFNSLVINDSVTVDSLTYSSSVPGFIGQTGKMYFNITDFLDTYGEFRDTATYTYSVSGLYLDGSPLNHSSSVILVGHRTGDFNLNGVVDIVDLVGMIDYLFREGDAPESAYVIDFNEDASIDISDLILFVELMFNL